MAPRKSVLTLVDLAMLSTKTHLTGLLYMYFGALIAHENLRMDATAEYFEEILFASTAPALHHRLASIFLEILQDMLDTFTLLDQIQSRARVMTQKLAVLVARPELEYLGDGRPLSESIATSILENLEKLSGIRQLACRSFKALDESALERRLTSCWFSFNNLVKFSGDGSCTDALIKAICDYCPAISDVTVQPQEGKPDMDVTDKSLKYLANCTQLCKVDVASCLKVTAEGLARFLAESKSNRLQWVELQYCVLSVLQWLDSNSLSRPIQLTKLNLDSDYLPGEQMQLAAKLLPCLRKIYIPDKVVPDLSCLTSLGKLEDVELWISTDHRPTFHRLPAFLQMRGAFITALTFDGEMDLPVASVFQIGALCPNLRYLKLETKRWGENNEEPEIEPFLLVQSCNAFENLEKFDISYDSSTVCKNVLRHAPSIKSLYLSCNNWANDEFFEYILQFNTFQQLEHLKLGLCHHHGDDHTAISRATLENVITSCGALKMIKYDTDAICNSSDSLIADIKSYLKTNNFNCKFSRF